MRAAFYQLRVDICGNLFKWSVILALGTTQKLVALITRNSPYSCSTISDRILKDRPYVITRNLKCNGYQKALASTFYTFFDKKAVSGAIATSKVGMSVN